MFRGLVVAQQSGMDGHNACRMNTVHCRHKKKGFGTWRQRHIS